MKLRIDEQKPTIEALFLPAEFSSEVEENPFAAEQGAREWATSVENERGLWRDTVLYPAMRKWVESIPVSKPVILDIGSGQGRSATEVDRYGAYIGVEPSRFLVDRAKSLYPAPNRYFLEGTAYHLPIIDSGVDGALMVNVLFHLENMDRAIREMSRVLKSGGRFFLNTVNFDAIEVWKAFYTNAVIDEKKIRGSIPTPGRSLSLNTLYFQPNETIEQLLAAHGLHIDRLTKTGEKNGQAPFITFEGRKG